MTAYNGALHWVGFKPESVSGTAETTVSTFLSTTSLQANHNMALLERKAYNGTGLRMPSRKGWIKPSGMATAEVFGSQPHPWYWALGAAEATQVVNGEVDVYEHEITVGDSPVSLTVEAEKVTTQAKQAGGFVSKLKLDAKAGEIATQTIDWLALSHDDDATLASTPTYPTDVLTGIAFTVSLDGSPVVDVPEVSIEFDNVLDQYPTLVDAEGAPQVIRRKEPPKITGSLRFADFPADLAAKMLAAETFELEVELLGATLADTYRNGLKITLPACQVTGGLDAAITGDLIGGDVSFEAMYDTASESQITVLATTLTSNIKS